MIYVVGGGSIASGKVSPRINQQMLPVILAPYMTR